MAMLALLPPHFAEGGIFAVEGIKEVANDTFMKVPDLYFDNSYYTIEYLLIAYLGFTLPFILPKMGRLFSIVSVLFGVWYFAAFIHEVWNFRMAGVVLNSSSDKEVYIQYAVALIIGIALIITRESWRKSEK